MAEKAFYTTLKNRGLLRVSGPDSRKFLQGLVSNDVALLDAQPCIYACLLTPQGKFLHDFFMTEKNGVISIECEGGDRARDLFKKLSIYKLRADVKIECEESVSVYAGAGHSLPQDPRHPGLGFRSFEKPDGQEQPFEIWDRHRIMLTVPDGSRDMIVEKSTLLESNVDRLNGISWDKGCYVGQELTARMHYRGLAKKHLCTVSGDLVRDPGEDIVVNGKFIGEMRSRCGDVGLALMKDNLP